MKGLKDEDKIASGGKEQKQEETANATPEELYKQNCISCHGENYEGGAGPALKVLATSLK